MKRGDCLVVDGEASKFLVTNLFIGADDVAEHPWPDKIVAEEIDKRGTNEPRWHVFDLEDFIFQAIH